MIFEKLRAAGHLAQALEFPEAQRAGGSDRQCIVRATALLVAGARAIAAIDRDDCGLAERFEWGAKVVKEEIPDCELDVDGARPNVAIVRAPRRAAAIAIILVGVPDASPPCPYEPKAFMMDDYVLSLACDPPTYDGLRRPGQTLVDHAKVMHKMAEVVALLDRNGIPVRDAKRMCLLFRAFANYSASQTTFAERLMEKCARVDLVFEPLLGDLARAVELLG